MSLPILSPDQKSGLFYFMKVLKKYIFFLFFAHPSFFYSQYSDTLLPFGSRYGMAKSLSLAQDTNVLFTWKQDFFPAYFAPELNLPVGVKKNSSSLFPTLKPFLIVGI